MAQPDANSKAPVKLTTGHFNRGKHLGQGTFSTVFLATRWKDGKQYAMKVVEKRRVQRNEMYRYVLMEKRVMNMLDHPNIIKLHWTFKDMLCVYLVMELGPGGELWELLQNVPEKKLPLDLAQFYAAELILVLEYLASKNIMHRDIKPENILLSSEGHLKVTDFGTSKIINPEEREKAIYEWRSKRQKKIEAGKDPDDDSSEDDNYNGPCPPVPYQPSKKALERRRRRNSFCGTAEYMPPEVLHNYPTKSPASDLWALGCCIFQFLAGRVPFKGGSSYLTFKKAIVLDYAYPRVFNQTAKDLITNLIQLEPHDRLGSPEKGGFSPLKAHPFFTDIDWTAMEQQSLKPPKLDGILAKIQEKKELEEEAAAAAVAAGSKSFASLAKSKKSSKSDLNISISNLRV